jgi:RNase P protein component
VSDPLLADPRSDDPTVDPHLFRFRRTQRLLSPAQFEHLRTAGHPKLRASRRWLSVALLVESPAARDRHRALQGQGGGQAGGDTAPATQTAGSPPAGSASSVRVRFGITVGKRNARRAVQRALVKRIAREAMRHAAPALERAAGGRAVDLVMRLKAPFPQPEAMPLTPFKRALRAEADQLLAMMASKLAQTVADDDSMKAAR